jgi:hypothetical protein
MTYPTHAIHGRPESDQHLGDDRVTPLWHRDVEAPVAGSARDASRERAALAVEEAASPRETFEPSLTFGDPHIPNMHNS